MRSALLLFSVLLSVQSFAGAGGLGGEDGGHGVLCQAVENFDSFTLQLLDLYEYRKLNHVPSKTPPFAIYQSGWNKIPTYTRDLLRERKNTYLKNGKADEVTLAALDHSIALVDSIKLVDSINDTKDYNYTLVKLPGNCEIIQLATYQLTQSGELVLLDRDAAAFISAQDLAALLLHEAFHYFIRDEDTISIRQRVGEIFIDQKNP